MPTYQSIIGKTVELTDERKNHILLRHPDIAPHISKIAKILLAPDEIRVDSTDKFVLLFYRYFSRISHGKYLAVAIKTNRRNFVLTFYSTHRIKTGEKYEIKKSA